MQDPLSRIILETETSELKQRLSSDNSLYDSFIQTITDTTWVAQNGSLTFKAIQVIPNHGQTQRSHLLKVMVNAGLFQSMPEQGMALLREACEAGDTTFVNTLFRAMDNSTKDTEGNTPLHIICRYGSEEVLRSILPNVVMNDLQSVIKSGHNRPITPLAIRNTAGASPLRLACDNPNIVDLDALLGDLDMTSYKHLVNDLDMTTYKHLSLNLKTLHEAAKLSDKAVIERLLDSGSDIDAVDDKGNTALMLAVNHGQIEIAKLLLDRGANVRVINQEGSSVMTLAMQQPALRSTTLLGRIREADGDFSHRILLNKELAHRFGIGIQLNIDGMNYQSTAWSSIFAVQTLYSALTEYYGRVKAALRDDFLCTSSGTDDSWSRIHHTLTPETKRLVEELGPEKLCDILDGVVEAIADSCSTDLSLLMERLTAGQPIGLCITDIDHCVTMAILPAEDGTYRIARCNKGKGSEGRPGILFDHAEKLDIAKVYPKTDMHFFHNGIEREFQFLPGKQTRVAQTKQKVGNCSVANTNGMELALLILQLEKEVGYDHAVEIGLAIKKMRCKDSRLGTLEAYLAAEGSEAYPPSTELLVSILAKKSKKSDVVAAKIAIAKWFTDHPDVPLNVEDPQVKQAFLQAINGGDKEVVQMLLARGFRTDNTFEAQFTPLHLAIIAGQADIVQLLLTNGANLEAKDRFERTPLAVAIGNADPGIVQLLIDQGAEIDTSDRHPLLDAAYSGNIEVIKLLLARGVDVKHVSPNGVTALMEAAKRGKEEMAEFLLAEGLDIEARDSSGQTALLKAVAYGEKGMVELLLSKGAKHDVRDLDGETALSLAIAEGHDEIFQLLSRL